MSSIKTHPFINPMAEGYDFPNASQPAVAVVSPQQPQDTRAVAGSQYIHIGSRKPVKLNYCPKCAKEHVVTDTRTKVTGTTWVCVVAGVVIFWPLSWLPLVLQPMKQTNHYCNYCGVKVGRVKPFQ